jgi:PEP-CTERM motif
MRSMLVVLMALWSAVPSQAQIYQITATGETTGGFGAYSTIPDGTPFTFTETFNAANATLVASTGSSATYADPTGTSSFSFDGLNFTGTAPQILINSNEIVDNTPLYGFQFSQFLGSGNSYAVQLLSIDPSVAQSTSLNSVHTSPISDFNNSLNIAAVNGDDGSATEYFTNTSFSVQVESAPEPSSVTLSGLSLAVFWWLRRRQMRN